MTLFSAVIVLLIPILTYTRATQKAAQFQLAFDMGPTMSGFYGIPLRPTYFGRFFQFPVHLIVDHNRSISLK